MTSSLSFSILQADALFKLLSPLVKDQADQPAEPPDPDDFEEEQMMMACLVDLFRAPEPDQQYMVCTYVPTSSYPLVPTISFRGLVSSATKVYL